MQADRLVGDIEQEQFCASLREMFDIIVNNQAKDDVFLEYLEVYAGSVMSKDSCRS